MKKSLLSLVFTLLIFFTPLCSFKADALVSSGYQIDDYKVDIKVGENNVLSIRETITANFYIAKHGIIRNIHYKGNVTRFIDGREVTKRYRVKLTNLKVSGDEYSVSRIDSNISIKIGDPDRTITGSKVYVISYDLNIGDDGIKEFDDLYHNIIPNNWDTSINNASFSITMPKSFDSELISFTAGGYGQTKDIVDYTISGNTISGEIREPLAAYEGVTIRLELPEGYFKAEADNRDVLSLLIIIGSVLLAVVSFIVWWRVGRDEKVYPTVEFYPPDGMNPLEVGYLIDETIDKNDVISLLIYWADKGYIIIEEKDKNDITLFTTGKDISDMSQYEMYMFQKMFLRQDSVRIKDLQYNFYNVIEDVRRKAKAEFSKKRSELYTRSSVAAKGILSFLSFIPAAVTAFRVVFDNTFELIPSVIAAGVGGIMATIPVMNITDTIKRWYAISGFKRWFRLIFSIILTVVVYGIILLFIDSDYLLEAAIALSSTAITSVIADLTTKRTDEANKWRAKILGFREFILKAEKEKIELLVKENPSYFYNILPYAYVLGVTNIWSKRFESIALQPPDWYRGYYGDPFTSYLFAASIMNSMNSVRTTMLSTPPSKTSGFGGIGGGGFSGGGFGGGGGGSW